MSDRAGWHERRRKGIGGSDIAAIVGKSPWKSPLDVYLSKTVVREEEDEEDTPAQYWGKALEHVILTTLMAERGIDALRTPKAHELPMVSGDCPWQFASPDALAATTGKPAFGVEAKTAGYMWGDQWDNGVPDAYLMQVQWYMDCLEIPRWIVAVLIGGNDFRVFDVERHEALGLALREAGRKFWFDHVLAEIPPDPSRPSDKNAVNMLSTCVDKEQRIEPDATMQGMLMHYVELQKQHKATEDAKDLVAAKIKKVMGEAAVCEGEGYRAIYRPEAQRTSFDVKRATADGVLTDEVVEQYQKLWAPQRKLRVTKLKAKAAKAKR